MLRNRYLQATPKIEEGSSYNKKYTEYDSQKAISAIQNRMPKRETSNIFNIPRATLQFRISAKFIKSTHGPAPILTNNEENILVEWINKLHRKGFPKRKENVQANTVPPYKRIPNEESASAPISWGLACSDTG